MKVISDQKVIYQFSHKMEHIETVSSGETFEVETNDCFFQQVFQEDQKIEAIDFNKVNPATGPIYVKDAEAGDLLKVKILKIQVKDKGVAAVIPQAGILGDQVKHSVVKVIEVKEGFAHFAGVHIPLHPMIGVIGVAPAQEDGDWSTGTPWKHGGNMDTKDITEGSVLYFPVHQKGALLALGDCHAAMGDGEVGVSGLEIPAKVTLQVELIKNKTVTWPLVETKQHTMVIASGDTLEDAAYQATDQAVHHLKDSLKISWEEAYILTSLTVDLKISQVVDPKMTVRAAIPQSVVSTKELIELSC